ncbi:hypothetical protein CRG98_021646 [Punica granatum]|uniref:Uncharacterized protein n=1 Tax=Punica granatum TaxID=22663 RepID=A0A2I0JPY7_PUNGR|nr:hypothetical protein CRG98_021646 [Punica granatum]
MPLLIFRRVQRPIRPLFVFRRVQRPIKSLFIFRRVRAADQVPIYIPPGSAADQAPFIIRQVQRSHGYSPTIRSTLSDRVEPDSEHEDKLLISTGPITRARAKKLEQALQNLWTRIREEARSSRDEQVDLGLIFVIKSAGPHQYTSRH